MSDYYADLNVNKDASAKEIKKSFRKLAQKHHPDRGGKEADFKKINEAYETLGDTNKIKDIAIHSIDFNQIGFPGNQLPVEIVLKAHNLNAEKIKLTITNKRAEVFKHIVKIDNQD